MRSQPKRVTLAVGNRSARALSCVVLLAACALPLAAAPLDPAVLEQLLMPREYAAGRAIEVLDRLQADDEAHALWPVVTFLRAERLTASGRVGDARALYRALVRHAADDPQRDTWGGHALVAIALYRWLELRSRADADGQALQEMARWADDLLQRRLVRSAFSWQPILPSLLLFEEQIYLALALEARRSQLPDLAARYLLTYLSRMRAEVAEQDTEPLYRLVIERGVSSEDRIALFRGRRLFGLGRYRSARPHLEIAAASGDEQVRLEAAYLLARASGRTRTREQKSAIYAEIVEYAARDDLIEDALYYGSLMYGPDDPEFKAGLERIVREYPEGSRIDDALYWLARGEHLSGRLDEALPWYERLSALDVESLHVSRAALFPSIALVRRAHDGDLDRARRILLAFVERRADSARRPDAQFWLGRIAEEQGRDDDAKRWFAQAVTHDPFGYYGLRARMHLASGADARAQLIPSETRVTQPIVAAYAVGVEASPTNRDGISAYAERVRWAVESGLYAAALGGEDALRTRAPSKRIQDFTFEALDEAGLLTRVAILMALRQDALAAVDATPELAERLRMSTLVGEKTGDWPLAMTLVHLRPRESGTVRTRLMSTPGYLRAAYPVVYEALLKPATLRFDVPPAVAYAVMRNESFFYPAAMSRSRALGLFQFIPSTFNELDEEWNLVSASGLEDRRAYLLDARHAIELGVRWFAEKKLPAFDGDLLLAVLAHHSGDGRVSDWRTIWRRNGWLGDVELMIETFRMPDIDRSERERWGKQSRDFARKMVRDMIIVDAVGLYRSSP